jgi:hypothetical protein
MPTKPYQTISLNEFSVIQQILQKVKEDICCAKIGKIQTFYPASGTADIAITFKKLLWDDTIANYPLLRNVPVFVYQGGGIHCRMPINTGDECVVIFADSDIDNWFTYSADAVPNSARKHDMSDGVAFVGFNSMQNLLTSALSSTEGGIADSSAKVAIKNGKISMANSTQSLKTALDTFLTACAGSTTDPTLASAAATLKIAVDALLY